MFLLFLGFIALFIGFCFFCNFFLKSFDELDYKISLLEQGSRTLDTEFWSDSK